MPPSSSRDGKLTLNVKNITVKELLQTIEKQSRYTFVYNISDLDPARRVSLSVTDASVEAVIAQAIPEVTATVRGTQVVLVRKAADKARPNVKITGTVRDADGVPLVGATLIVEGTTLGMSTGRQRRIYAECSGKRQNCLFLSGLRFGDGDGERPYAYRLPAPGGGQQHRGRGGDGPRYHP